MSHHSYLFLSLSNLRLSLLATILCNKKFFFDQNLKKKKLQLCVYEYKYLKGSLTILPLEKKNQEFFSGVYNFISHDLWPCLQCQV